MRWCVETFRADGSLGELSVIRPQPAVSSTREAEADRPGKLKGWAPLGAQPFVAGRVWRVSWLFNALIPLREKRLAHSLYDVIHKRIVCGRGRSDE